MGRRRSASQKDIANRINKLLKHFGVKPKILALMLRVSESTVKRWQKGIGASRTDRLLTLHKLEELMRLAQGIFKKESLPNWYYEVLELYTATPIDYMIKNNNGIEEVTNLIGCIKWGINT